MLAARVRIRDRRWCFRMRAVGVMVIGEGTGGPGGRREVVGVLVRMRVQMMGTERREHARGRGVDVQRGSRRRVGRMRREAERGEIPLRRGVPARVSAPGGPVGRHLVDHRAPCRVAAAPCQIRGIRRCCCNVAVCEQAQSACVYVASLRDRDEGRLSCTEFPGRGLVHASRSNLRLYMYAGGPRICRFITQQIKGPDTCWGAFDAQQRYSVRPFSRRPCVVVVYTLQRSPSRTAAQHEQRRHVRAFILATHHSWLREI